MTDEDQGDLIMGREMPSEISAAIVEVMAQITTLGFDERNEHGKYNYVSIDKFMEVIRPLCAKAKIFFALDETDVEVRPGGREGSNYLFIAYDVWVCHQTGVMAGPWRRRCFLPATGPQAFGAAESYVLKRFQRNLFQVATGEKDADETAPDNVPAKASKLRPAKKAGGSLEEQEARRSYSYLASLIDACTTTDELREVYNCETGEWNAAEAHAQKVVNTVGVGPLDILASRWHSKYEKLFGQRWGVGEGENGQ